MSTPFYIFFIFFFEKRLFALSIRGGRTLGDSPIKMANFLLPPFQTWKNSQPCGIK